MSRAKDIQELAQESRFFLLNPFQFAVVEPDSFATEAFVNADVAESDFFQFHPALRALHEVEGFLALTFVHLELRLAFAGELAKQFGLLAGEIFLFIVTGLYGHESSLALGYIARLYR